MWKVKNETCKRKIKAGYKREKIVGKRLNTQIKIRLIIATKCRSYVIGRSRKWTKKTQREHCWVGEKDSLYAVKNGNVRNRKQRLSS